MFNLFVYTSYFLGTFSLKITSAQVQRLCHYSKELDANFSLLDFKETNFFPSAAS